MGGDSHPTETVDYSHFDPKFTNKLEKVAPEWGDFHQRRAEWIEANRGNYFLTPEIRVSD